MIPLESVYPVSVLSSQHKCLVHKVNTQEAISKDQLAKVQYIHILKQNGKMNTSRTQEFIANTWILKPGNFRIN